MDWIAVSRDEAISRVRQHFQSGGFLAELDRRIAFPTESQNGGQPAALRAYLEDELRPAFSELNFTTRLIESPSGRGPYLLAEYVEGPSAPTVLSYGHGDVVVDRRRLDRRVGRVFRRPRGGSGYRTVVASSFGGRKIEQLRQFVQGARAALDAGLLVRNGGVE
jgi:hypothetical protein